MEGDDRAFGMWHEHRGMVRKIVLQARSVLLRLSWLKDLRDLQLRSKQPAWSKSGSVKVKHKYEIKFAEVDFSRLLFNGVSLFMFTGAPCFEQHLINFSARLGQTVKLACKITGTPKPGIKWFKGKLYT